MQIQFLGATGTVTGSRYLVTAGSATILVDCGLFQGYKQLRLRNREPFPVAPATIDAVLLSHAHLDHSGYLPVLVENGFSGRIYCTQATFELCKILLSDSARLLEEEADYANRHGFSRHHPALPLYTEAQASKALTHFTPVALDRPFHPAAGLDATLRHAGHILGAATVSLGDGRVRITFSGDLGRPADAIILPPAPAADTDYLVVESTYGDRLHERGSDAMAQLADVVNDTAARGGAVIIPAFAVARAQTLIYMLYRLRQDGAIPASLPVYLNSPMAADVSAIYLRHAAEHRIGEETVRAMFKSVRIVNSVEESIALNQQRVPMVIIAGSGMATGGRVLHHLKAFAPDPRNTILFVGFQAGGTRGASMLGGAESVKIHGNYVPVRARVVQIEDLSAHADQAEIIAWLSGFRQPPKTTFITHGEPAAADALRHSMEERLGWNCIVPDYLQRFELG
ncbi:MAG: MBL fold metallo-hydrolase [Noviherbaspirillum sp.]